MKSVLTYKKNVFSQNGEDGIIEYIFNKMNITKGNFIDFGAWDGKHLSNSYKLFIEGWGGIFIEGDTTKFNNLKNNFSNYSNITCINSYVGYSDIDSLDTIIDQSSHNNKNFDFISIDVDGLDYFIFEKMNKYLPKVVCIEVSSGHSPDFSAILPDEIAKNNVGQSIEVMSKLGNQKGYFTLCYTGNLFLIKNEFRHIFQDDIKNNIDIYFDFLEYIVGPDKDLIQYLYNLYCSPHKAEREFNQTHQFNFIFPENEYMKSFCMTKLS